MTIRIYYSGSEVAGYYDMTIAAGANPLAGISYTGYFDILGSLDESHTLANINIASQSADIVLIPDTTVLRAAQAEQARLMELYVTRYSTDVLAWADLSPTAQSNISAYRSQLLAVPSQPEYPSVIDWPTPPTI